MYFGIFNTMWQISSKVRGECKDILQRRLNKQGNTLPKYLDFVLCV